MYSPQGQHTMFNIKRKKKDEEGKKHYSTIHSIIMIMSLPRIILDNLSFNGITTGITVCYRSI